MNEWTEDNESETNKSICLHSKSSVECLMVIYVCFTIHWKKFGVLFTWENLGKFLHLEIVSKFYKGDHQVNFTCGYNFILLANLR